MRNEELYNRFAERLEPDFISDEHCKIAQDIADEFELWLILTKDEARNHSYVSDVVTKVGSILRKHGAR